MRLIVNRNFLSCLKVKAHLIKDVKKVLFEYLHHKKYALNIIKEIASEEFIASNPDYYIFYPYLFNNYFQVSDKKILNLLSVAGFLYYKYTILIDNIFDRRDGEKNFQSFFIANICQEETIKILCMLFNNNTDFWNVWNKRKHEYKEGYYKDKTLQKIKGYYQYEELVDHKSAFGKIAIDCLYYLSLSQRKNKSLYKLLLETHKLFYLGFQIMDDIIDYKKDTEEEQFNISKHELINSLKKENKSIKSYSLNDQYKLTHLKGVTEKLYIKAVEYTKKACILLEKYNKKSNSFLWVNEIINLHNIGVTHLLNIKGFIDVFKAETQASKGIIVNNSLGNAVKKSIEYITNKQTSNGNWNDILNDAGVSDVWTTSYVIYALSDFDFIDSKLITKGRHFISSAKLPSNLWGYNTQWIDDADSSSFALLSLKKVDSFESWLNFQNKDGGFATYNSKNALLASLGSQKILNVKGWVQSHFCVSAVAYLVFVELNQTAKSNFSILRNYLTRKLKAKSKLLSYWWTNDICAIYHLLLAAIKVKDNEIIALCKKRLKKITERKISNYFFRGLLLNTICLESDLFSKHRAQANQLANQILLNQYTDGAWEEGYSLKIPHPSVMGIKSEKNLYVKANKGTNIVVKDYNKIFTTISCFASLKKYEERIS